MDTLQVIQTAERLGFILIIDGDHIRIKQGKSMPGSLKASIKEYKPQILATLKRDQEAKENGLMIGIPGQLYTVTLSNVSCIYVEHIEDRWEAWRETNYPHQRKAIGSKIITTGNTFDFVLLKVKRYLDYINRKRKPT